MKLSSMMLLLCCRHEELQQKSRETLQFIHDIRPEKAGTRTARPQLPDTEDQRLALGEDRTAIRRLVQSTFVGLDR